MASHEVILITGANTGLGYQMIRALCGSDRAYTILLAGRSLTKAQQAVASANMEFPSSQGKVHPIQIDIEDDESIQHAFEEVQTKFGRLDALINNAGAQFDAQYASGHMSMRATWLASWNTNTVGTQVLTSTFAPLLLESSNPRLLFITSGTSTLSGTDNMSLPLNHFPPKGWPKPAFSIAAYRASKTGMNMLMREWYRVLHEDGVKVWCLSPGFLATGLGGNPELLKKMGAGDPEVAGAFVKSVLEGERDADVGRVVTRGGVQPW